ncbi:MAG: exodeoxyribonuclease V subunit gamma [Acidobacteria bacterium]|nr:exodeoxyribonuclease V subunit gamma [Acidobacteriota bacterium]
MNRVVVASSALELREAAVRWAAQFAGKTEMVVLAATRAAADEFVRALPGPGSFGIHRFTIAQFAASFSAEEAAPVTRLGAEAVAARAVQQAGALRYFEPVATCPGFASALASTIEDLRLARVRPADLAGSDAALDLAALVDAYERALVRSGLADLAGILGAATEGARRWPGLPLLLLDLPLASRAYVEFVSALALQSPAVCAATLAADERRVAEFERILGVRAERPAAPGDDALERLRRNLFLSERPEASAYDETLALFSSPGESLEAVEIARRILRLGARFDRIAILLRNPERYQPLIEEALRRARIPAYFSRGTARPDAGGRAFLALLGCAADGCSASRFAEYLSLGQIPPLDGAGAPAQREAEWIGADDELFAGGGQAVAREPVDAPKGIATPLAWEKLIVDAAVIGKYERWERRLRGLEGEFRIQLAGLGPEDQNERERLERELDRLATLEHFALPLIEQLHALPKSAVWRDWLDALRRLAARALPDSQAVLQTLAELEPMAEVGPVGIDEVYGVLADRLRTLRQEPPHRRYGAVFIGAIDEARGRVFDYVFLPGLAEGLFPKRANEDPLLLDVRRREISPSLATSDDRIAEERLLLHTAVASAARCFTASYPSMDLTQGRPRVPSFYALEIARAIEGRVPQLREFEKRLSDAAEARLVWPAPKDAAHSIDDAEYDLAWLAAHRDERGGANYLLGANPHLGRSLRTRWARWESKWTPADGFVHPDTATLEHLLELRPSVRDHSPSSLQHYAACPYRFMLAGVLHLRERKEAVAIEQLDPLTRGSLVHEVQREFLRDWKSAPSTDFVTLMARLDDTLDRVARDWEERIAPAIERVWRSEIEDVRTDVRGWMIHWHAHLDEWEPVHFELGFGLRRLDAAHDPASWREPVDVAGVRARGSIDLVERHRARGVLRITDYKTGKPPEREPAYVGGGTVLQPMLYALAAERMLDAKAETGRLFYCTQRGAYVERPIAASDPRARQFFARAMSLIDDAMAAGFLPAAPDDEACDLCEFTAVCGPHEEARVRRWKDLEALDALRELRAMP